MVGREIGDQGTASQDYETVSPKKSDAAHRLGGKSGIRSAMSDTISSESRSDPDPGLHWSCRRAS
jgi:hypothetical protein